jgi:hypothetical protein
MKINFANFHVKKLWMLIILLFMVLNICFGDDSDTKVVLVGEIVLQDPSTSRIITYEKFAPISLFERIQSQLKNADAVRFIKPYIGKKVSNDTKSMLIRDDVVTAYYGKYIVVYSTDRNNFYITIVANDVASAFRVRDTYFPKKEDIPYGVSFEIWTENGDIIGRDRLGDYEDLL